MFDYAHLEALLAVEREGSFEGAARSLGVTSSAVSQRIKLLEERIGAVVINRQAPIKPTHVGIELCRHAELVSILEDKIISTNDCLPVLEEHRKPVIKIVVNDDSLSSWRRRPASRRRAPRARCPGAGACSPSWSAA